jgi:hypothetical protein
MISGPEDGLKRRQDRFSFESVLSSLSGFNPTRGAHYCKVGVGVYSKKYVTIFIHLLVLQARIRRPVLCGTPEKRMDHMKRYLVILLLFAIIGAGSLFWINSISQGLPPVDLKALTTPTTVTVSGPVILSAIHSQATLETTSMILANDQDITKTWGLQGACQESLTYLSYYTVTAGVDLQNIAATDIVLDGNGVPAQTAVTLTLRPAEILHVELDTERSRVVHSADSIISQLCGTQLPEMVLEAQTNLRTIAEQSALQQGIIKMAEDQASFEMRKIMLLLGYTNVTVQFKEATGDQLY